eukprot:CAMPEP_0170757654 /NCGR_PEP_ID=MMETSP0437-20130122/14639_1 /TAXON_ID=0 /ORGANISM="Sexangularia sp." /LENGTH=102 /DNA_ID=CAMNT_0011096849 /DNA_START=25 /DNA_END=330 /DNA_ORIENTATION=-
MTDASQRPVALPSSSTLVHGVNALITKPAQSLAPLLGSVLVRYVTTESQVGEQSDTVESQLTSISEESTFSHSLSLTAPVSTTLALLVSIPLGLTIMQLLTW